MNDFAEIELLENGDNAVFKITLKEDCAAYEGHFPGDPTSPGVLLVKVISDGVATLYKQKIKLKSVRSLKFLSIISPEKRPTYNINIEHSISENIISVKAIASDGDLILYKFQGKYECSN